MYNYIDEVPEYLQEQVDLMADALYQQKLAEGYLQEDDYMELEEKYAQAEMGELDWYNHVS